MARSVDIIQKAIIADIQARPELSQASSTSKRAIWRLWAWVVAACVALFEQLLDLFKNEMEKTISNAAPQTTQWLQSKCFQFQYDTITPQVLQLIDLVPKYPVIDTGLCITTRCSVRTILNNSVIIKVAKNEPPEAFNSDQINALQSYINILGVAGVYYSVTSQVSDKLFIEADIYYNGAYSAIVLTDVTTAINNYLSSLPFDGAMKINDLEAAIRAVTGVNDILFRNVKARADGTDIADATYLVTNNQFVGRLWNTISGYIVGETTTGNTFADTLNFIAE